MTRSTALDGQTVLNRPGVLRRSRTWIVSVGLLAVVAAGCVAPPTNPPNPTDGLASAPAVTPTTLPSGALHYGAVRYGTTSGSQYLDLYVPAGTGPFPLVVWFHGGYWTQGARWELNGGFRDNLLAAGYAVATADYRLAEIGVNLWPAGLLDAKLSVKFLRTYASQLDLDAGRIVTSGHSAGGHLAVMVAISRDAAGVKLNGGDPAVSGAFVFGAPIDIPLATTYNPLASLAVGILMGCGIGGWCDSSPMQPPRYLDDIDPPVKLVHGEFDIVVPPATANPLVAKAAEVGYGSLSTQTLAGKDHDTVFSQAPTSSYLPWLAGVL